MQTEQRVCGGHWPIGRGDVGLSSHAACTGDLNTRPRSWEPSPSHVVCTEASSGISGLLGTHASNQGPARLVAPTGAGPTGCSLSPGCGVGRPSFRGGHWGCLALSFPRAFNSQVVLAFTEGPRSQVDVSATTRRLAVGQEGEPAGGAEAARSPAGSLWPCAFPRPRCLEPSWQGATAVALGPPAL